MRRRLAAAALGAVVVSAVVASAAWWFDARTKPERVGPCFVDALVARHPGATVAGLDGGVVRATLGAGTAVDVRLSAVFDDCAAARSRCSGAIDAALADVDAAAALARAPRRAALRPVVVGEAAGYRYGYVTEPLVAALEVRYALVAGRAWTYVTPAMADAMDVPRARLGAAALANARAEPAPRLERIDEHGAPVFRVRAAGDPAATLLDDERMRAFADAVGTRRLYAVVPTRGTLALAAATDAGAAALDALRARLRGPATNDASRTPATSLDSGLVRYDADAPADRRLSLVGTRP